MSRFSQQVQQIQEQIQGGGLPFSELLSITIVQKVLAQCNIAYRERILTPLTTLWVFLTQLDSKRSSCCEAVSHFINFRVARGQSACSPETGGYCTARKQLPEEFYEEVVRQTGRGLAEESPEAWHWKGRPVKVADGTTVSMPDTPENREAFPPTYRHAPGVGFPMARLVVIFCLATGVVLERAIGPCHGKQTGEISLFRTISDCLQPGDVFLGDRHYCTYADIAMLQGKQVDVVVKLHQSRRADFRRGARTITSSSGASRSSARRAWIARRSTPCRRSYGCGRSKCRCSDPATESKRSSS